MARLTFLGSSGAVPAVGHDNAFLALEGEQSTLLIDCAGSPLLKLELAGIDPLSLQGLILTHAHADHIYGFPLLAMDLWLLGCRERPLKVFGDAETLDTARALLELFRPEEWPGFCPPTYHEISLAERSAVLEFADLIITASPVDHLVPTIALRIVNRASRRSVVYSSDTAPCESLVRLARGADILIHEATGDKNGHSSAAQAGQTAQRAQVGTLYLIHYSALTADLNALLAEASQEFSGPVELARDFGSFEF